jgi:hypothetical protein
VDAQLEKFVTEDHGILSERDHVKPVADLFNGTDGRENEFYDDLERKTHVDLYSLLNLTRSQRSGFKSQTSSLAVLSLVLDQLNDIAAAVPAYGYFKAGTGCRIKVDDATPREELPKPDDLIIREYRSGEGRDGVTTSIHGTRYAAAP